MQARSKMRGNVVVFVLLLWTSSGRVDIELTVPSATIPNCYSEFYWPEKPRGLNVKFFWPELDISVADAEVNDDNFSREFSLSPEKFFICIKSVFSNSVCVNPAAELNFPPISAGACEGYSVISENALFVDVWLERSSIKPGQNHAPRLAAKRFSINPMPSDGILRPVT